MKNRFIFIFVLSALVVVFASFGCSPNEVGHAEKAKAVRVREHSRPARDRGPIMAFNLGFVNES